MPIDIEDADEFSPIVAPVGTDRANRANVVTVAQGAANRTRYLANRMPNGALIGPLELAYGTIGINSAVRIVGGARLYFGAEPYTVPDAIVGVPHLEGGGTYAANAWYYLYARWTLFVGLSFQLSLTPPEPGTYWKNASVPLDRYLGVVRSLGSGTLVPFHAVNGEYRYRLGVIGTGPAVLTGGVASAWASVDLSAVVPPRAGQARLRAQVVTTGAEPAWVELVTGGDGATLGSGPLFLPTHKFEPPYPAGTSRGSWEFDAVVAHDAALATPRTVDYRWADASGGVAPAGGSTFRLDVFGFRE